jgi:DNA-binding NarL/FixJ family response regulator
MIGFLIADDHDVFRELLREVLSRINQDWVIVGEAATGEETRVLTRQRQPDLVLLDCKMRGIEHLSSFCREIIALSVHTRILMISGYIDEAVVLEAAAGGAHGYIVKGGAADVLAEAITAVLAGKVWVDPSLPAKVARAFAGSRF